MKTNNVEQLYEECQRLQLNTPLRRAQQNGGSADKVVANGSPPTTNGGSDGEHDESSSSVPSSHSVNGRDRQLSTNDGDLHTAVVDGDHNDVSLPVANVVSEGEDDHFTDASDVSATHV